MARRPSSAVSRLANPPRQMQDFMRLYSSLVEKCFNACTQDFTSKALSTHEVSPLSRLSPSSSNLPTPQVFETLDIPLPFTSYYPPFLPALF